MSRVIFIAVVIYIVVSLLIIGQNLTIANFGFLNLWFLTKFNAAVNGLIGDPIVQFYPWLIFIAKAIRQWEVPLWNPYNGFGAPFLANYQSAFFFFPNIVYYLFPGVKAITFLLLFKFLISFTGFFVFADLLVDRKRRNYPAAVIAALAYAFSGFNILWLQWPHTNTTAVFPWTVATLLLVFRNSDRRSFILHTLSLICFVFSGHPEMIFLAALIYLLFLLILLWHFFSNHYMVQPRITLLLISYITTFMITSVQLLPFAEYLLNSIQLLVRSHHTVMPIRPIFMVVNWLPNFFGNPSHSYQFNWYHQIGLNFNEAVMGYTGITILFTTILFAFFIIFSKRLSLDAYSALIIKTMYLMVAVLLLAVYNFGPFSQFFANLPVIRLVPLQRLLFNISFLEIVIFYYFLLNYERIWTVFGSRVRLIIEVGVSMFLVVSLLLTYRYSDFLVRNNGMSYGMKHLIIFVLFLIATYLFLVYSRKFNEILRYLFLGFLILIQTIVYLRNYNPLVSSAFFYPESKATRVLKKYQARQFGRFLVYGTNMFFPNINLAYALADARNYDTLLIKSYKDLADQYYPNSGYTMDIYDSSQLQRVGDLNIRYIISRRDPSMRVGTNISDPITKTAGVSRLLDYFNSQLTSIVFFDPKQVNLGLTILTARGAVNKNCRVRFDFIRDNQLSYTQTISCLQLPISGYYDLLWPSRSSQLVGRYRLVISLMGKRNDSLYFYSIANNSQLLNYPLYQNPITTRFLDNLSQGYKLWLVKNAKPRYWLTNGQRVTLLEERFNSLVFKTGTDSTTKLVVLDTYFPGWKAVDQNGQRLVITRYQNNFRQITVKHGTKQIRLYYDPLMWRLSLCLLLLGLLILLFYRPKLKHS